MRLRTAAPFAGETLLAFLGTRAVPGVEWARPGVYLRTLRAAGATGWVRVELMPTGISVRCSDALAQHGAEVTARIRNLFDLDADIEAIEARLAGTGLASHVRARPGLRVPGAVDGFEIAARAVLGQQISVAGARTLAGRLAARFGDVIEAPLEEFTDGTPTTPARVFPTAARIAAAPAEEIQSIGMPLARARCLQAFAAAIAGGDLDLTRGADPRAAIEGMCALPGIGPWTAHYVAMRALGWRDAFLAGDLGVRKALGGLAAREAEAGGARWRPFRAYAVVHLWSSLSDGAGTPLSIRRSEEFMSSRVTSAPSSRQGPRQPKVAPPGRAKRR